MCYFYLSSTINPICNLRLSMSQMEDYTPCVKQLLPDILGSSDYGVRTRGAPPSLLRSHSCTLQSSLPPVTSLTSQLLLLSHSGVQTPVLTMPLPVCLPAKSPPVLLSLPTSPHSHHGAHNLCWCCSCCRECLCIPLDQATVTHSHLDHCIL